jgi:hypothetical protein
VLAVGATVASPYTLTGNDDIVIIDKTVASASSVVLPPSLPGRSVLIKDGKGDASSNTILITPAAGNIDNQPSYTLNTNNGWVQAVYDGTQWRIIG